MSLFQAEKLIDLACSTTHEEEARTAALAACRLIRKHGMRLTSAAAREPVTRSRARAAAPEPVREKPPNGGSFARASRRSRCESCGGEIALGDEIYVVAGVTWCGRH
ncbi:MAG TPA: hypothetical protein VJR89_23315 [Polyangiales bacterium]|nr:hypothetical protein [Polyangiales bacterium]